MSFVPENPRPFLQGLVGKRVCVRLKWGETEYTGKLVATDLYMNLLLGDTEEHILGEAPAKLGQVLIRCNNVLWIAAAETGDGKDVTMEG